MTFQRLKQNRKVYEYVCANLLPVLGQYTPILVYQMGRGGSSSLRNSLMRVPSKETELVFHFHDFFPIRKMDPTRVPIEKEYLPALEEEIQHANKVYATFPLKQKTCWYFREHYYALKIYNNVIKKHRPAKIITLVREPISTNISMFFQLFERYTGVKYENSQFTTQQLIDIFLNKYNFTRPLTWFDVEMKPALGIDIYRYPLPQHQSFLRVKAENIDLLALKAEMPDPIKEQTIAEFVGLEHFELMRSNVSEKKKYANQYQEFGKMIRFSEPFVDEMYNSKFARHFYSAAELGSLRAYWLDRN